MNTDFKNRQDAKTPRFCIHRHPAGASEGRSHERDPEKLDAGFRRYDDWKKDSWRLGVLAVQENEQGPRRNGIFWT